MNTIERGVTIDAQREVYNVEQFNGTVYLHFDRVLDEIERIVIELVGRGALAASYLDNELTSVQASRGTLGAYDTLCNLRAKLQVVCTEQGEKAVANLSPQLMGLELHQVEATDEQGETRRFVVGVSDGWMPTHIEISRDETTSEGHFRVTRTAQREYESVTDLGVPPPGTGEALR